MRDIIRVFYHRCPTRELSAISSLLRPTMLPVTVSNASIAMFHSPKFVRELISPIELTAVRTEVSLQSLIKVRSESVKFPDISPIHARRLDVVVLQHQQLSVIV
jgi:hypothetical protein